MTFRGKMCESLPFTVCPLATAGIGHVIENHSIMRECSSKWKKEKIGYNVYPGV
ncbi:hypothetical protein A0R60_4035 [Enterobacter asburiae]|nr:hypothetical protein A0R60_4035 [Enterobacter asburiae]